MTKARPTEFEALELKFPCYQCGAPVGEWCWTKSGRDSQYLHAYRHHAAVEYRWPSRRGEKQ